MRKTHKRILISLFLLFLVGLIVIGIVLGWFFRRGREFDSRPLVLFHTPIHNGHIAVGDSIMVHATAREDQGLMSIELWVNGSLVDELEAEEPNPTNLVLFSNWTPSFIGHHELIVRAVSSDGIYGQSTISVFAEEAGLVEAGTDFDQDGGQIETGPELDQEGGAPAITTDTDLPSADDPADVEFGISDESTEPGIEPEVDEPPAPSEEDREAPFPDADAPLMGLMFESFHLFSPPVQEVPLRIEIPRLQTGASFDRLHCYVSLADSLPQWYPDLDRNQATDETFEALDDGWWNTESTLVGSNAPVILWPEDQSLPMSVSCVGVNGGIETDNFRRTDLDIPPERWNGVQREYDSEGESGPLFFTVSITQLESIPRAVPKWPDSTMTSPTNVRLNESAGTIEWDYEPEDDEEEIDGFRIYLNGNLQWTEPADALESRLPREWFNPPCASTYTFGVTAFRLGFPDGPESYPGTVDLVQPREGCMRRIQVIFYELETFDLGDDGDRGDIDGDRGPVYGAFYANDQRIDFDGWVGAPGYLTPQGLHHNTIYSIPFMVGDPSWSFDGPNYVVTDVPADGTIRVGFYIMDRDGGGCSDPSDDPGCDDVLCSGTLSPIRDDAYHNLDGINRETITAENGRCVVRVEYRPAYDSPVGSRGEGGEPLPWVEITDFSVDESSGEVSLEVVNGGTADWPGRDLVIGLQNREGALIGTYAFEGFYLPPGERDVLRHPRMVLEPPYDACAVVDPFDDVLELYERNEVMFHNPICPRIPDLEILDVYYESTYGNYIRVAVRNVGDGVIDNRTLEFLIRDSGGTSPQSLIDNPRYPGISLGPGEIHIFEFPELDEVTRTRMAEGYVIVADPEETIFEQARENNWYTVGRAERLEVFIRYIQVPYAVRDMVEFELDAYIVSGREQEQVLDWNFRQDIDWGSCLRDRHCVMDFNDIEYANPPFIIYGDQELKIDIRVDHPGSLWHAYEISETFPGPHWGGIPVHSGACNRVPRTTGKHTYEFDYHNGTPWFFWYNICEDRDY